ncbi:MAG TPA: SRPBCC family protein [Thermoplasmata archaeon]|nr:SRPBCC family protein [Thermoplasmata archaeon]
MVQVRDDGVFDAPIDKIWKYLQDETPGVHSHRSIVGTKTIEEKGNALVQEMQMRNPDGKTTRKETWRFTFNPPTGFEMESLGGASKGTRYSHRYTPLGNKTRVDVEGDFRLQGMDESQTRKAALGFLSELFEEDNRSLRNYK